MSRQEGPVRATAVYTNAPAHWFCRAALSAPGIEAIQAESPSARRRCPEKSLTADAQESALPLLECVFGMDNPGRQKKQSDTLARSRQALSLIPVDGHSCRRTCPLYSGRHSCCRTSAWPWLQPEPPLQPLQQQRLPELLPPGPFLL